MSIRRRVAAASMAAAAFPSCAPAVNAHRGRAQDSSAPTTGPAEMSAGGAPGSTAPTPILGAVPPAPPAGPATTVTITLPTVPRTTTTLRAVLPEYVDEGESDIVWLIRQTFPETPDKAVRVARCESTLDPGATNGQHVGLMQIATKVHAKLIAAMGYSVADLFQPLANLHVARAIYDDAGGWSPWTCAA